MRDKQLLLPSVTDVCPSLHTLKFGRFVQILCLLDSWPEQVLEEEPCEGTLRLQ